jgi:hypothetical protein
VFNFHHEGKSVRDYAEKMFSAAKFLGYVADVQQLVDRIVMNLHPSVLIQAAFLDRPVRGTSYIVRRDGYFNNCSLFWSLKIK